MQNKVYNAAKTVTTMPTFRQLFYKKYSKCGKNDTFICIVQKKAVSLQRKDEAAEADEAKTQNANSLASTGPLKS